MQAAVPPQAAEPLRNDAQQAFATKLGSETDGLRKTFYLITFSRILDETLIAAGGHHFATTRSPTVRAKAGALL